jgi:hypothetical protein
MDLRGLAARRVVHAGIEVRFNRVAIYLGADVSRATGSGIARFSRHKKAPPSQAGPSFVRAGNVRA